MPDGTTVRTRTYNMEDFFQSCIDLYKKLAPAHFKLKKVSTPFLHDSGHDQGKSGNPNCDTKDQVHCPWCQASFPKDLNHPKEQKKKKAKIAGEESLPISTPSGELQPYAAKILMKMLYGARLARFDVLRAIN